MLWLKRNILLVISALGALALLGIAIVYLLSEYAVYNSYDESIKQLKDGIKTLSEYNPTPSEANIAIIKNNGVVLKKFMGEAEGLFVTITNQPIAPGPFMILLDKNIAELTREATNSGITLPPDTNSPSANSSAARSRSHSSPTSSSSSRKSAPSPASSSSPASPPSNPSSAPLSKANPPAATPNSSPTDTW